eukprot:TRINITY_DN26911_c0_g1_i1.p1 TRINITY_DN26911_c0_g1~~TRINITY_DN26911_c0_g1_i1.p1  ORF type:complete len:541 (+),score=180.20 TRINITY_DN26911_c0_g1_i1:324-1946(+)
MVHSDPSPTPSRMAPAYCAFNITGDCLKRPSEMVVILLYEADAPSACTAFKSALRSGRYAGSLVHRVIPGFIVQGGKLPKESTPHAGDSSPPSPSSAPAFDPEGERKTRMHSRGGLVGLTKSMQFYVTLEAAPHLNASHCVIGEVVSGMHAIRDVEKFAVIGRYDRPSQPIHITSADMLVDADLLRSVEANKAEGVRRSALGGMAGLPAYKLSQSAAAASAAAAATAPHSPTGPTPALPEQATLETVVRYQYPQDCYPALSLEEGVALGTAIKSVGNGFYRGGDSPAALQCYEAALRYLNWGLGQAPSGGGGGAAADSIAAEKSRIFSNMSACLLGDGETAAGRNRAREAVKLDDANVKALYRYALSLSRMGRHSDQEAAWGLIGKAVSLTAGRDAAVNKLYNELKEKRAAKKRQLSHAMSKWAQDLDSDPLTVSFTDSRTHKRVVIKPLAGGGITYTLNGEERGRIHKVTMDVAKRLLSFPELRKNVCVPGSAAFPPEGLHDLCQMQGVDVRTVLAAAKGTVCTPPRGPVVCDTPGSIN